MTTSTTPTKLGKFRIGSTSKPKPERIFLYGSPKVGKTTFAASAPNPFLIDLDRGAAHLDIPHNEDPIESLADLQSLIRFLVEGQHDFQTVILDTLDRAEALVWKHVCEFVGTGPKNRKSVSSIEEVGGGFGKGYSASYEQMRQLWGLLEECWSKRNMRIIVLAHAKVETFKNPSGPDFDRYVPKVHKDVSKLFFEVADAALFATRNVVVRSAAYVPGQDKRYHAIGGESRVLYTQEAASHLAGNRYGLPDKIDLDWDTFVKRVAEGHSPALLEATIRDKARRLGDPQILQVLDARLADAHGDLRKLLSLMGKLDARLDKAAEAKAAEEERQAEMAASGGGQQQSESQAENQSTTENQNGTVAATASAAATTTSASTATPAASTATPTTSATPAADNNEKTNSNQST
jgi:hypothetical protein